MRYALHPVSSTLTQPTIFGNKMTRLHYMDQLSDGMILFHPETEEIFEHYVLVLGRSSGGLREEDEYVIQYLDDGERSHISNTSIDNNEYWIIP